MDFQFLLSVAATFSLPVCDSNYHDVTQLLHWMLTIVHIPAVYISSCMYSNYVPELMTACVVVYCGVATLFVSFLSPLSPPHSLSCLPSSLSLPSTPLLFPLSPFYPSPPPSLSPLPLTSSLFSSLHSLSLLFPLLHSSLSLSLSHPLPLAGSSALRY